MAVEAGMITICARRTRTRIHERGGEVGEVDWVGGRWRAVLRDVAGFVSGCGALRFGVAAARGVAGSVGAAGCRVGGGCLGVAGSAAGCAGVAIARGGAGRRRRERSRAASGRGEVVPDGLHLLVAVREERPDAGAVVARVTVRAASGGVGEGGDDGRRDPARPSASVARGS